MHWSKTKYISFHRFMCFAAVMVVAPKKDALYLVEIASQSEVQTLNKRTICISGRAISACNEIMFRTMNGWHY